MAYEVIPYQGDERIGYHLTRSGFFKELKSLSQAMTKITLGRALGLDAASSVLGIFINSQGKISLSANLMARTIKAYCDPITKHQKYKYRILEHSDKVCSIQVWEWTDDAEGRWKWEETGPPIKVTIDQFKHLQSNDVWKKYPQNMLFARAISNVAKFAAPDAFGGSAVYTPGELPGDGLEVDGETLEVVSSAPVVEATFEVSPESVTPSSIPTSMREESLTILGFYREKLKLMMERGPYTWSSVAPLLGVAVEQLKALASTEEGAARLVDLLEKKGKS